MRYVERTVPALGQHVECVWAVSSPRSARAPNRIVPDGCPEIIVHLADPFERRDGARWRRQPRAFLAGTLTRPWIVRSGRRVMTMGLRFRPGGFTALFDTSLLETADRELALADMIEPAAARDLLTRLARATSTTARLAAAEAWLLAQKKPSPRRTVTAAAIRHIAAARGQVRVDDVARHFRCTRRHLERMFARDLGVGPKVYARIVRLNVVLARLDEKERASAVDLALEAGFFDQAHLLRDFRIMVGHPPERGRGGDGNMAQHFTRPERLRPLFLGE